MAAGPLHSQAGNCWKCLLDTDRSSVTALHCACRGKKCLLRLHRLVCRAQASLAAPFVHGGHHAVDRHCCSLGAPARAGWTPSRGAPAPSGACTARPAAVQVHMEDLCRCVSAHWAMGPPVLLQPGVTPARPPPLCRPVEPWAIGLLPVGVPPRRLAACSPPPSLRRPSCLQRRPSPAAAAAVAGAASKMRRCSMRAADPIRSSPCRCCSACWSSRFR